jgi:GNAT superfamily N-acetyltransferase
LDPLKVTIASEKDIEKLIPVFSELRKQRTHDELREMLSEQMKDRFQVIYIGTQREVFAMACFRKMEVSFSGKTLYVDDLVTHPGHRRKGYGEILLRWMIRYAKDHDYDHFSLDSGDDQKAAHQLYRKYGLEVDGAHFASEVGQL